MNSCRTRKNRALTRVEVLVIFVMVGAFFVLAAMMLPALQGARERARRASCMSNLKQIGLSCHLYSNDWREAFPIVATQGNQSNDHFYLLFPSYMSTVKPFVCPATDRSRPGDSKCRKPAADFTAFRNTADVNSYAYVAGLKEDANPDSPVGGDNLADATKTTNLAFPQFPKRKVCSQGGGNHKTDGGNVLFVDGHALFNAGTQLKSQWRDHNNGTSFIQNPLGIKDGT